MGHADWIERFSAIVRPVKPRVEHIDRFCIQRVRVNVGVIPCSLSQFSFVVYLAPFFPAIVRTENAAILSLDQGPNAVWTCRRYCQANLPYNTFWQTLVPRNLSPRVTLVGRFKNATSRSATFKCPWPSDHFP